MMKTVEHTMEFIDQTNDVAIWQMKNMPYKLYLLTRHWQHFRKEALKFYQNKCQTCGKVTVLDVHHRSYDNIGEETFNDVIVLCHECHGKFHGIDSTKQMIAGLSKQFELMEGEG